MKTTRKTLAAVAALILFAAIAPAKHRDPRIVYDAPSPVLSAGTLAVMVPAKRSHSAKAETYRFSASIETTPGEGCEGNTVLYFLRNYTNTEGFSAGLRQEVIIRKATVTSTAELPAVTFRIKTRHANHVLSRIHDRREV